MRTEHNLAGLSELEVLAQRRARAVVTAWILAAVAVAIFVAFILSGVLNS